MENKVNVTVAGDNTGHATVTILHGDAVVQREPKAVNIAGQLNVPQTFYKARFTAIDKKSTHVVVRPAERSITLIVNEASYYAASVKGSLKMSREMELLGINASTKAFCAKDLANTLRKMPNAFIDRSACRQVVDKLNRLDVEVNAKVKEEQDTRGNSAKSKAVTVKTDLPDAIALRMPIFDGCETVPLTVELHIEAYGNDIKIYLESEQLYADIDKMVQDQFEENLVPFLTDGIAVLYC